MRRLPSPRRRVLLLLTQTGAPVRSPPLSSVLFSGLFVGNCRKRPFLVRGASPAFSIFAHFSTVNPGKAERTS